MTQKGKTMDYQAALRCTLFLLGFTVIVSLNAQAGSAPDAVKGAEYVGTETCISCHEEQGNRFKLTSHYKVVMEKDEVLGGGCESCHGAGSLHAESMNKKDIVRYAPENCFNCHWGHARQRRGGVPYT